MVFHAPECSRWLCHPQEKTDPKRLQAGAGFVFEKVPKVLPHTLVDIIL